MLRCKPWPRATMAFRAANSRAAAGQRGVRGGLLPVIKGWNAILGPFFLQPLHIATDPPAAASFVAVRDDVSFGSNVGAGTLTI